MVPRKEETKLKTTEAKELKEEQEAKQEKAAQKTSGTQEAERKQVGCAPSETSMMMRYFFTMPTLFSRDLVITD